MITGMDGRENLSAVLKTCGEYLTEKDSVEALLSKVNPAHWVVHTEVNGWLLSPRSFSDGKLSLRADVVLEPTDALCMAGWRWGPVVVECKKSGANVGHALNQILDYGRCLWSLPGGFDVMPRFCFLFPFAPPGGTVASLMVNNRIGGAYLREYARDRLVLRFNGYVAYEDGPYGGDDVRIAHDLQGGSKTGSR